MEAPEQVAEPVQATNSLVTALIMPYPFVDSYIKTSSVVTPLVLTDSQVTADV